MSEYDKAVDAARTNARFADIMLSEWTHDEMAYMVTMEESHLRLKCPWRCHACGAQFESPGQMGEHRREFNH